jgi:hypothetical protein
MKSVLSFLVLAVLLFAPLAAGLQVQSASAAAPTYSGYPTFSIVSVVADTSVTIKTKNLPANDEFRVLMGKMGTRGVNGTKVTSFETTTGGEKTFTFSIPAGLLGLYQIAIRIESKSGSGYFAYNWFYNNTSSGTGGQPGGTTGYSGYPTIKIQSVVKDTSVTVRLVNLPKNDEFRVLMGRYGTRAVGGIKVISIDTQGGGNQTFTFTVPAELKGLSRIAIRIQSKTGSGYFAYNWFFNSNAP